jgi:restriction system protein
MTPDIPKYDDFMLPTLKALRDLGGSGSNEEIQDKLTVTMALTPEQLEAVYPTSGVAIAPDRMTWARSYLKIAGMVASGGRALWVLTDEGRDAADWPDARLKRFVADAFNVHERRRKQERVSAAEISSPVEEEVVLLQPGAEEAELDWSDQLLAALRTMHPSAFERLCQRLLRESGFVKVEVTGKSGDGGIDGVGVLRMNLISFQVLFQCKRYAGSVSSPTVRDFRGAMQGRADKGLIITTGTFTADARKEATRDGAPAIDLVDGELLCELLKQYRLGVAVRERVVEDVSIDAPFLASI